MDLGCVQERDAFVNFITQNQRQFRPAQDQAFNFSFFLQLIYDLQQVRPRLIQVETMNQLFHILFMNIVLVLRAGDDESDALPREYIRVEMSLHGEARANQTNSGDAPSHGGLAGRFDDTDQRNWRAALNLVEDDVRGTGRQQAESGPTLRQFFHLADQIIRHCGQFVRPDQIQHLGQVNAVDDDRRITPVRLLSAIRLNDQPIIRNGRLWPDPADDSESLHYCLPSTFGLYCCLDDSIRAMYQTWPLISVHASIGPSAFRVCL